MTIRIDEVQSEVVIEAADTSDASSPSTPLDLDALRAVIREILREELERYLRTHT